MLKIRYVLPLLLLPTSARAFPIEGPPAFCSTYPDMPACRGGTTACLTCHSEPPVLNPYGASVREALPIGERASGLPDALLSVEDIDSDGDGRSNVDELLLGTHPGNSLSAYIEAMVSDLVGEGSYSIGQYNPEFALRRLKVAFCGVGPSYDEVQALKTSDDPKSVLHASLDACLVSDYWRHEAVPRLADSKIRPLVALGTCETLMADFEFDYRLFSYAMTGGRDIRDLLTADYHVGRDASGELVKLAEGDSLLDPPIRRAGLACRDPFGNSPPLTGGQILEPSKRAGMLTTQWFLVIQTQASYLPRTTAAAAYRSWLGYNIANYQGLFPVVGEPRDIDDIGIDGTPCYQCHSTLDPLAYSFAYYNGVGFDGIPGAGGIPTIGSYDRTRPTSFFVGPAVAKAEWGESPPVGVVLGQEIPAEASLGQSTGLVQMAKIMAASDAFASNMTNILWTVAVGHSVGPGEHGDFSGATSIFVASDYSADALIHAIIDTHSFGAP